MSEQERGEDQGRSWGGALAILLLSLPIFLFLPLLLSLIEHQLWSTNHVEETCRDLGIHSFLGRIYEPIISVIQKFF